MLLMAQHLVALRKTDFVTSCREPRTSGVVVAAADTEGGGGSETVVATAVGGCR